MAREAVGDGVVTEACGGGVAEEVGSELVRALFESTIDMLCLAWMRRIRRLWLQNRFLRFECVAPCTKLGGERGVPVPTWRMGMCPLLPTHTRHYTHRTHERTRHGTACENPSVCNPPASF